MEIVIATTTCYQNFPEDTLRYELALKMMEEAKNYGIKVVVVDNSSESLKGVFRSLGALVDQERSAGMGKSRRQAILRAFMLSGLNTIAWMEPEKHSFVQYLPGIADYMESRGTNLVIPGRKDFFSYPFFQQLTEQAGNEFFRQLTGRYLDMWMGPRVFDNCAVHYFLRYAGEYGDQWDSMFIPVLRIIHDGLEVEGYETGFQYPPEQRKAEECDLAIIAKRTNQFADLVEAMSREWQALKN